MAKNEQYILKESEEQQNLFSWVRRRVNIYPDLWLLHHIPNGGTRQKVEASHLKAEGVRKGVPDISLPVPRGKYHGAYIEMKRTKGGTISADQKEWLNRLINNGYAAVVCYGAAEAGAFLKAYLSDTTLGNELVRTFIDRTLKKVRVRRNA